MSLLNAARDDAQQWPGTQEALSITLFGTPASLRHKLVGYRNNVFSLEDAQQLMLTTGGRETIRAQARELGGVYLELPPASAELDNADLLAEYQQVIDRLAAVTRQLHDATANDGQIDANERGLIERARHELNEQVMRYLQLSYLVYGNAEVSASVRGHGH